MAKKKFSKLTKENELSSYSFLGFFFFGMAIGAFNGIWEAGFVLGLALGLISALIIKMKYVKLI